MTAATIPERSADTPLCPTHDVPAIPQLARDSSGAPFIRYACDLCAVDLGIWPEPFILGTTTQRDRDARQARDGRAA